MSSPPEQRSIRAGSQLIYHMIYSQAGSLEKALAEYAMNSVDAGATQVRVSLTAGEFVFGDNGAGFRSRAEIEEFFEQLAFEHVEGDRRYGRFGLGRAQAWAFASTAWRTGEFLMDVDIKRRGLDYLLTPGLPVMTGCEIRGRLYERLLPSDLECVRRGLVELVQYAPIPIWINGEQVTKDPAKERWDFVTDEAYIKLRDSGDLAVYNLGILTKKFSGWSFGTGGTVVSRVPLTLNVARNDILQSACKAWPKIRKHLDGLGAEKAKKRTRLSDDERKFLVARLLSGEETYESAGKIKLVPDVKGRLISLSQISKARAFTVAPETGSRVGERAHEQKLALVLDPSVPGLFDCDTPEALTEKLFKIGSYPRYPDVSRIRVQALPFDNFKDLVNDTHVVLDPKELTDKEKAIISALSSQVNPSLPTSLFPKAGLESRQPREIRVGESDAADAWTDGRRFIAISRPLLKLAENGASGFVDLVNLLAHEYVHDQGDLGSHQHDHNFYQAYHDLASITGTQGLAGLALRAANRYAATLRQEGKRLSPGQLKDADRTVITGEEGASPDI